VQKHKPKSWEKTAKKGGFSLKNAWQMQKTVVQ
jgi:hypothetical protein